MRIADLRLRVGRTPLNFDAFGERESGDILGDDFLHFLEVVRIVALDVEQQMVGLRKKTARTHAVGELDRTSRRSPFHVGSHVSRVLAEQAGISFALSGQHASF